MQLHETLGIPPGALEDLGDSARVLLGWYDQNKREMPWRSDPTPYHVWVSEIMLQQTRVEAVRSYYQRFVEALPTVAALANCPEERLFKLWEGLGYYSRARNMHRTARILTEEYGGELPSSYQELLGLPGIGTYTAGAIASIAFGQRTPAPDGNVYRVLSRLLGSAAELGNPKVRAAFGEVAAAMIPPDRPGDFNQSLMELGAIVCLPNGAPLCHSCPWRDRCAAHREDRWNVLPVKAAKKPRKVEDRTILLLLAEGRLLLNRRPRKGLLAGMPQPLNLEGHLDANALKEYLAGLKVTCHGFTPLGEAKHIFTHKEWRMTGFAVFCDFFAPPASCFWATQADLRDVVVLPSAFRPYLSQLPALLP